MKENRSWSGPSAGEKHHPLTTAGSVNIQATDVYAPCPELAFYNVSVMCGLANYT
jgi:hypothetical protein